MRPKVNLADVLNERALRVRNRFEVPVLIAALLVVPVIFIEERASSEALHNAAVWANWLIWLVFAISTHSETGQPIHNGTTRRRPTSDQRRHVEARNPTCIFPGCRMPATDCDLDHRTLWSQGGPTSIDQLEPLCRHDHFIRHKGWKHQPLPGGEHLWTSRLGHTYTTSGRSP